MGVVLAVVVPVIAAVLQGAVAPFVAVGAARPNLVVLAAASWSVAAGPREAAWWAFIGGVTLDLLSGGPLGGSALAALVPVVAVGMGDSAGRRPRSVVTGALLVAAATVGAAALYLLVLGVVGRPLPDLSTLLGATIGTATYNGVLALVIYPLCRKVRRSAEKQASLGW